MTPLLRLVHAISADDTNDTFLQQCLRHMYSNGCLLQGYMYVCRGMLVVANLISSCKIVSLTDGHDVREHHQDAAVVCSCKAKTFCRSPFSTRPSCFGLCETVVTSFCGGSKSFVSQMSERASQPAPSLLSVSITGCQSHYLSNRWALCSAH